MIDMQEKVTAQLTAAVGEALELTWRISAKGVATCWCSVAPSLLFSLGRGIKALDGRLSAITGYLCAGNGADGSRQLAYHFDLDGTTLTAAVTVPVAGATVPSLTPLFRNADWNERELMELYQVTVEGHPDPRRLFLDDSLEAPALERLIPYSTFINAASTRNLFESVLSAEEKECAP